MDEGSRTEWTNKEEEQGQTEEHRADERCVREREREEHNEYVYVPFALISISSREFLVVDVFLGSWTSRRLHCVCAMRQAQEVYNRRFHE